MISPVHQSAKVLLSDPHNPLSSKLPTEVIALANANVTKAAMKNEAFQKQKGSYLYLTDAQQYQVGKRAAEIEITNTLRYYVLVFH